MINAALAGGSVNVIAVANTSNNILRLWSTGDAVRDLQVKLNKLGYGLAVDGIYGQNTFNAVEHFQSAHGLSVDGIAGPKTMEAINSISAVFTPNGSIKKLQGIVGAVQDGISGFETLGKCLMLQVGSQGDIVKWLQYVLNSLCHEELAMDGILEQLQK